MPKGTIQVQQGNEISEQTRLKPTMIIYIGRPQKVETFSFKLTTMTEYHVYELNNYYYYLTWAFFEPSVMGGGHEGPPS